MNTFHLHPRSLPRVVLTASLGVTGSVSWQPSLAAENRVGLHTVIVAVGDLVSMFKSEADDQRQEVFKSQEAAKPAFYCANDGVTLSSTPTQNEMEKAVEVLRPCDEPHRPSPDSRTVRVLAVTLVDQGSCPATSKLAAQISEVERKSTFELGLRLIVKEATGNVQNFSLLRELTPKFVWCVHAANHRLEHGRGTVTITAKYQAANAQGASQALLTGPDEHWFISADALFKGAKSLKWDSSTRSVKTTEVPDRLYVGVNYMVGDILSKHPNYSTDRLTFKALVSAKKRPFDSYGMGLGYRFSENVSLVPGQAGKDSGGFMAFAGVFWTKGDVTDASGNVTGHRRDRSFRVGLSYSLDQLVSWKKQ